LHFLKKPNIIKHLLLIRKSIHIMNLVIDIGNTRTKIAVFDNNLMVEKAILQDGTLVNVTNFLAKYPKIDHAILSTVAKADKALIDYLSKNYSFIELGTETPVPFRNQYKTPETLGKDRIAAAAAAKHLFPRQYVMVIDCGTCIKYDLVTDDGIFKGGNIAPGINMRIKAMNHFTARLPEVRMDLPKESVGFDTETALQNGAVLGAILEIEGFAAHFREKHSRIRTILTGGDAEFLSKHLKIKTMFYDQDLVLKGLNLILKYNFKKQ
jgi:type III pantothenate kinase